MARPAEFRDNTFKPTIFNRIEEEIAARSGAGEAPIALHVGDTWFELPGEMNEPLPEEPWNHHLSRYGDTQGEPELRRRLARKVSDQNHLPVSGEKEIQLTFGATGGLFLSMRRLLEPGDEVLVLSPYWTIFRMVAATAGARVVEVPFFDRVAKAAYDEDVGAWLEPYLTERTAAIYFNNPNNPSGVMLTRPQLESVAAFALEKDLWVLSDEAYEDFVWTDRPYVSIGSLPKMFERTVSVFSFSKSYAAAGLRLGYVAAPLGAVAAMNPGHVGTGYEPNRPAQVQAIRAIERRGEILPRLQSAYRDGRKAAMDNLNLPYLSPEGSFYLFLDLRERWDGLSEEQILERMLSAGVVLSTGSAFGAVYKGWARFCFTAEAPAMIAEAARRANSL